MEDYKEFFDELMSDNEVRKEYEALEPEFQLVRARCLHRHEWLAKGNVRNESEKGGS